jgi:hypothetical protein
VRHQVTDGWAIDNASLHLMRIETVAKEGGGFNKQGTMPSPSPPPWFPLRAEGFESLWRPQPKDCSLLCVWCVVCACACVCVRVRACWPVSEIQTTQLVDGHIPERLAVPIYLVFPRLFTCPSLHAANFKIEFSVTLQVTLKGTFLGQLNRVPCLFTSTPTLSHTLTFRGHDRRARAEEGLPAAAGAKVKVNDDEVRRTCVRPAMAGRHLICYCRRHSFERGRPFRRHGPHARIGLTVADVPSIPRHYHRCSTVADAGLRPVLRPQMGCAISEYTILFTI